MTRRTDAPSAAPRASFQDALSRTDRRFSRADHADGLRKGAPARILGGMKISALAALVLASALPSLASDRPAGASNPSAGPTPASGGVSSRSGGVQVAPVVTLPNRFGTPGEKIKLEADVRQGGSALSGFALGFWVDGKKAGDAATDASGRASLDYTVPDNFVQKHYEVKATAPRVEGKGDLSIFKCKTVLKLGDLIWGTYKDEPGAPSGSYTFSLTRISDGRGLNPAVPVEVTVNGTPYNPGNIKSDAVLLPLPPLPAGQKTWKVKVAFAGNDSYLASADEKTFTKP